MKVICKCCHKAFDYDMYMGLCPKCGRVYRRGKEHYSIIEKDMMGDFHLHADEGGLNRGIHGVVYNQGSTSSKEVMNRASKATVNREIGEPAENPLQNVVAEVSNVKGQTYYAENHKTRMNQGVAEKKNNASALSYIIVFIIVIIAVIAGMLD